MELKTKDWKEFRLNKVFTMKGGFYNKKPEHSETGTIPFLASTENNNGVTEYYSLNDIISWDKVGKPDNTIKNKLFSGNCIVVTVDGSVCNAYYQKTQFTCSHSITQLCLSHHKMNEYIGQFLCVVIMMDKYRWNYGRKPHDVKKFGMSIIKLPIKQNENNTPIIDENRVYSDDGYIPDWQFMEDFIKSLHYKPITTKVKAGNTKELEIYKWEEFKVSDLFTLLNGKGITKEEIEENSGTFVAVQSGEENNGVLGKIDKQYCIRMGYTLTDKMCLTVARTGSAGFVSFQSTGCVVGDSAKILLLNDDIATTNIYLFLQTVLTANRFKYDYGRKVTEDKYLADIIKLPIKRDNTGNPVIDDNRTYSDNGYIPDWQFMEDYINSLPYSDRI